jgi:hypothetical protein
LYGGRKMGQLLEKEVEQENPLERVIHEDKIKVEMNQTINYVRASFTSQQNVHLNNSIRFADAKAGALVTINGLILKFITDMLVSSTGVSDVLFKTSLIILIVSILCSFAVVYPRLVNSKDKGIIYWEHINNYGKEGYVNNIIESDAKSLLRNSLENNFYQAKILTEKFKRLVLGFRISILGYLVITVALIFKYIIQ